MTIFDVFRRTTKTKRMFLKKWKHVSFCGNVYTTQSIHSKALRNIWDKKKLILGIFTVCAPIRSSLFQVQYSNAQIQFEHLKHRCKMMDEENQRLMRLQNDLVMDANRRVEVGYLIAWTSYNPVFEHFVHVSWFFSNSLVFSLRHLHNIPKKHCYLQISHSQHLQPNHLRISLDVVVAVHDVTIISHYKSVLPSK